MSEMKREHERQNPDEYATDPHQHAALAPGAWCNRLDDLDGQDVTGDTPLCSYQAPKEPTDDQGWDDPESDHMADETSTAHFSVDKDGTVHQHVMTGAFEIGDSPDVLSVIKDGTAWAAAVGTMPPGQSEPIHDWQPIGHVSHLGFVADDPEPVAMAAPVPGSPIYQVREAEPEPDISFGGPGWFERFRKAQAERDEIVKGLTSVTQSFSIDDPEAARAFLAALESPVRISMYKGDDDALVVQMDTENLPDDVVLRVNVNDAPVFQGRPEHDRSDLDKMQSVSDVVARWAHGHLDPSAAMSAIARVVGS